MKKCITTFLFCGLITLTFFSQFSISAGPSLLKPFGIPSAFPGFHISGEFNDDDVNTLYARFSFFPSKKGEQDSMAVLAYDMNTNPYIYQIGSREKFNYSVLEFGKRYYFGDGYESGFGFYGGSNINIVFNKLRYELDDYDEKLYYSETDVERPASIIGFALGLNGGIKNSFYFGTLYLDAGLNYSLIAIKSPNMNDVPSNYSNIFFGINIGIRKDFY